MGSVTFGFDSLLFALGDGLLHLKGSHVTCWDLCKVIFGQIEECPPSSLTLLTFGEIPPNFSLELGFFLGSNSDHA